MQKLKPHHKNAFSNAEIEVEWNIYNNQIDFLFKVTGYCDFNTKDSFSNDYSKNSGLWDYDVVEVFISRSNRAPYLELQCSPLNQPFALVVEIPRLKTKFPNKLDTNFEIISKKPWVTSISIPLSDIPGSGNILYGNCFSCLGSDKTRSYYALHINNEDLPDFHRPELFIEFGEIK